MSLQSCLWLLLLVLMPWPARAQTPPAPQPAPSADGAYVIDPRSKLAWPRCVEGMVWNGRTCTGEPQLMTHAEATAWAARRASYSVRKVAYSPGESNARSWSSEAVA